MIHPARYDSLGEILHDATLQFPDETATIEVERERENTRTSYREFRHRRDDVAAWLSAQGVRPGDRVAIVMSNQTAWLVAAAAGLHLGCILVPLDSRLTPPEQSALLQHASPRALFADDHLVPKLEHGIPLVIAVGGRQDRPGAHRYEDTPRAAQAVPLAARTRDDVAAVVYSSGTGGDPKGCLLTHGNYLAQYQSLMETFTWRRGDRYLSILPTNHAIDFMCGFVAALCTGSTVIHQRTLRPEYIVKTIRKYRITQMAVVPLILRALERGVRERLDPLAKRQRQVVDALASVNRRLTAKAPSHGLSRWLLKPIHDAFGGHLRVIFCGGAFTDRSLAEFFYDLGIPVAIGYGSTEACTVITVNDLKPFRADSVGRTVPGVSVRIHEPGPDGVGEVQVRGPTVFAGYLDAPELTEAVFDGPWLKTGDLGWLDASHHLHLVGRQKNMIVTPGGKNIYPEDIEHAFQTLACEELVVFAEDFLWRRRGLEAERLVAVVRPEADADRQSLQRTLHKLNQRLPDFKRVQRILFWDTAFPRTASMKVKRVALAEDIRQAHDRSDLQLVSS